MLVALMPILSPTTLQSYTRVADWLVRRVKAAPNNVEVIGINGAQGSGKTTLSHWLCQHVFEQFHLRGAVISLDDFYRTRAERLQLAQDVHPLLATRGVPGTHDAVLGREVVQRLKDLKTGQSLTLPRFDKATDDRVPAAAYRIVEGPLDFVLFEGWCVGLKPEPANHLCRAVNSLEALEDSAGHWRRYVNEQLAGPYADWFGLCDALVLLAVPSWEQVFEWRRQQEQETAKASGWQGVGLMGDAELRRFMDHYERLTRHALATLPQQSDVYLRLDLAHSVLVEHMT